MKIKATIKRKVEQSGKSAEEILSKISKISVGCLIQDYKQKCITPEQAFKAIQEHREQGMPSKEDLKQYLLDNYKPFMIDDMDANEYFRECALICMNWVLNKWKGETK